MGRSNFRGLRGRLVSSGRKTLWIGSPSLNATVTVANSAVLMSVLNAAALALRPFTVVRTRGHIFVHSDQIGASELYDAAYGEIIVSEQASAAGVASVPTPLTDDASNWHVYERAAGQLDFGTGVGFRDVGHCVDIDSKAMRKVDEGEDLISVMESGVNSNGVSITVYTRVLIKLH